MHRLPGGSVGELWEFPGGKCEPEESPREALVREWLEETGLTVGVGEEMVRGNFTHKGVDFVLIAFEIILPDGADSPALREHDDYRWVRPEELVRLDLDESDRVVADYLVCSNA